MVRVTVKGAVSSTGPSFAVTYTVVVPGLSFGDSPVQDVVQLVGTVCLAPGSCTPVSARGWNQLIGGVFPTVGSP